eukprot:gene5724-biopygen103
MNDTNKMALLECRSLVARLKNEKAYNTPGSQVVSHPSTRRACRSLTSQIGRDAVYSPKYGRKRKNKTT